MAGLSRGVLEARLDIFSFQIRVIFNLKTEVRAGKKASFCPKRL
jgi:hypothetical protein